MTSLEVVAVGVLRPWAPNVFVPHHDRVVQKVLVRSTPISRSQWTFIMIAREAVTTS